MSFFKSVLNFYLQSSIHVSLAVLCFSYATFLEYDLPIKKAVLGFIFFGTITGYNFIKYAGIAGLHHRSLVSNLKIIQLFSLLSFGFFLFFLFQVSKVILITSLILGFLTLFYGVPFFKNRSLRDFNGLKIYIVALVWAGVTVLLPWVHFEKSFTAAITITFFQRFLWVLVLMIPFEIRDLPYDSVTLGTLPQRLGVSKTKWLGYFFLLIMLFFEAFKDKMDSSYATIFILMVLLTGVLVWFSKKKQSGYYSSLWVEGIPILWVIVVFFKNVLLFHFL